MAKAYLFLATVLKFTQIVSTSMLIYFTGMSDWHTVVLTVYFSNIIDLNILVQLLITVCWEAQQQYYSVTQK